MTVVALSLYLLALGLAFGVRTVQQIRRTGRSGWVGVPPGAGTAARWGAAGFAASLVLGVVGLVLSATGPVPDWTAPRAVNMIGVVAAVAGLVVVLVAQSGMGESWRIGVDPAERTQLVTGGAFRWARNPIFTGMITTQLGVFLMVPSWLTGLSLACLIAGVQAQVRAVEEPYLARMQGQAYRDYAAHVGRFLPKIGRLPGTRDGIRSGTECAEPPAGDRE